MCFRAYVCSSSGLCVSGLWGYVLRAQCFRGFSLQGISFNGSLISNALVSIYSEGHLLPRPCFSRTPGFQTFPRPDVAWRAPERVFLDVVGVKGHTVEQSLGLQVSAKEHKVDPINEDPAKPLLWFSGVRLRGPLLWSLTHRERASNST